MPLCPAVPPPHEQTPRRDPPLNPPISTLAPGRTRRSAPRPAAGGARAPSRRPAPATPLRPAASTPRRPAPPRPPPDRPRATAREPPAPRRPARLPPLAAGAARPPPDSRPPPAARRNARPADREPLPHHRFAPPRPLVDPRQRRHREGPRPQPPLDGRRRAAQQRRQVVEEQHLRQPVRPGVSVPRESDPSVVLRPSRTTRPGASPTRRTRRPPSTFARALGRGSLGLLQQVQRPQPPPPRTRPAAGGSRSATGSTSPD